MLHRQVCANGLNEGILKAFHTIITALARRPSEGSKGQSKESSTLCRVKNLLCSVLLMQIKSQESTSWLWRQRVMWSQPCRDGEGRTLGQPPHVSRAPHIGMTMHQNVHVLVFLIYPHGRKAKGGVMRRVSVDVK